MREHYRKGKVFDDLFLLYTLYSHVYFLQVNYTACICMCPFYDMIKTCHEIYKILFIKLPHMQISEM